MSTENQAASSNGKASELDRLASEIFRDKVSKGPIGLIAEQVAVNAYKYAETFLKIRDKVRAGELSLKEKEGPKLAEASCPNFDPTHPLNLVSQRFGDLNEVNRIKGLLDRQPLGMPFKAGPISWDEKTTALAREVLPQYCSAA